LLKTRQIEHFITLLQHFILHVAAGLGLNSATLICCGDNKSYNKLYNIFAGWDAVDLSWAFNLIRTWAVQVFQNKTFNYSTACLCSTSYYQSTTNRNKWSSRF